MSDRLTALDATFLELEEADDSAHMHIGAAMVFDALPGGGVPTVEEVREHLDERIDALPRYRQRLSSRRTGGLRWPEWVADERFDIAAHVRHATLPEPGGEADLHEWAADNWSHRLDRARPLWDIVLLDGLEGGRWALVTRTHHCLVDGIGSVDIVHLLLDAAPDAAPGRPEHAEELDPALVRAPAWLAAPVHAVETAATVARRGAELALHPLEALRSAEAAVELLVRDELVGSPRTSLNQPISSMRRFTAVTTALEDVRESAHALGGTVNDAVLCAVSGGLRELLLGRGESPPHGLRAMVPMNLREASQHDAKGNRITSLFLGLPVDEPDALARFAVAHRASQRLKHGNQPLGASTVVSLAGLAPPVLHVALARSLFATRLFNVTVTNVPGPPAPLYAFGARMRTVLPLVPLAADHAVGVAIVSYAGTLNFGLVADRDDVPDLDVLAEGIKSSLAELRARSSAQPA